MTVYQRESSAVFRLSRERHGALSNMTMRMPVRARGLEFQSSEGLYQALKFPDHPKVQQRIGQARTGMDAKRISRAEQDEHAMRLADWIERREDAMRFTLAVKLEQNPKTFGAALLATNGMRIVEESRFDDYWGAKAHAAGLVGTNRLGTILEELRALLVQLVDHTMAARRMTDLITATDLTLNGQPALSRTGPDWKAGRSERANGGRHR